MSEDKPTLFNLSADVQELLTGHQQNVQSKLYKAQHGLNPLTTAAAPLFSFNKQLRHSDADNLKILYQSLIHEIKAFENQAHKAGYNAQIILAARYLICCLLDDTLNQKNWTHENGAPHSALTLVFQQEYFDSAKFFMILKRSMQDPQRYVDLLEFGYLCLSLGFEGEARTDHKKREHLIQFSDELYQVIHSYRGKFSKRLLVHAKSTQNASPYKKLKLPPVWLTILVALLILVAIYIPYMNNLNATAKPMQQLIQRLQQIDQSNHE